MRKAVRRVAVVGVLAMVTSLLGAAPATSTDVSASIVLDGLTVRAETTSPAYDRAQFPHWEDADGDGCDTRAEVLVAESLAPVTFTSASGCTVATGRWTSWLDGATWTAASDVDIDHTVPLQEAWQSGASSWTLAQRRAFANDLDLDVSLQAVTDEVNQSKGARDPAEWMPYPAQARCEYAVGWVLVKHRWRLTVDTAEAQTLRSVLVDDCADPVVTMPARADVPDPGVATAPFRDVGADHPFATEIAWLAGTGVTTGYADGGFHPGAAVTRQAFAAYLYRYTHGGADAPACTRAWFGDVPVGNQFCGEIWWLASTGITTGYADGGFHPTAPITRQAMAAFLQRYRETEAATGTTCDPGLFDDMAATSFCGEVTWLASTGITTGYVDGTFRPAAPVTRQATAAYLHRYDAQFEPSDPPAVVGPPATHPANPGDAVNCTDFRTWAEAQAWYDRYFPLYGDVARLDSDGDGIACESLPGAP